MEVVKFTLSMSSTELNCDGECAVATCPAIARTRVRFDPMHVRGWVRSHTRARTVVPVSQWRPEVGLERD